MQVLMSHLLLIPLVLFNRGAARSIYLVLQPSPPPILSKGCTSVGMARKKILMTPATLNIEVIGTECTVGCCEFSLEGGRRVWPGVRRWSETQG